VNAALVVIGDRLGLYRVLATNGPLSAAELAQRTGTVAGRPGSERLRRTPRRH
jgi:hypothetical protein